MILPSLNELNVSREMIDVFYGYNHNLRIGEGEFYDMKNLSSTDYPVLSPRKNRGIYATPTAANGMIAKDCLCYVDGADFVIGEDRIDMGLSDSEKTLVSMGAYVIIMPDKKYINTLDTADRGDIEAEYTSACEVGVTMCDEYGRNYFDYDVAIPSYEQIGDEDLEDGMVALDWESRTLVKYSEENKEWLSIPSYIKLSSPGIGSFFEEGDTVYIKGIVLDDISALIHGEPHTLVGKGEDYIFFLGCIYETSWDEEYETPTEPLTVTRGMPNMDFLIECNNRLWGCRYGLSVDGKFVNEIYASALGDFKNWYTYSTVSTASYAASVGSDGPFTGAITHLGYPLFFKENCMYKIYGSYPANFQIQNSACRGVQAGCDKSLAIVNEVLFYKSRCGVCAYDGSLPTEISSALGDIKYSNASAGGIGNKYYISMSDEGGGYNMLVFDTSRGLWHKEDSTHAGGFCQMRGELYFIDADDGKIKTVNGSGAPSGEKITWSAEGGIIGISSPDKKYISRLDVRLSLSVGARVRFFIEYDSSGHWEHAFTATGTSLRSFSVPIRPRRCDHLRLRIEGDGEAKIYSICKTIEQGGLA